MGNSRESQIRERCDTRKIAREIKELVDDVFGEGITLQPIEDIVAHHFNVCATSNQRLAELNERLRINEHKLIKEHNDLLDRVAELETQLEKMRSVMSDAAVILQCVWDDRKRIGIWSREEETLNALKELLDK